MLKAVCLNDNEHYYLIKFIEEYRDENGQQNISSAIRFLMQKGYESIYGKVKAIPYKKSVNKEEIKQEILNEVLSEVNTKLLTNLTTALDKLGNIQVVSSQNNQNVQNKPVTEIKKNTPKKTMPAVEAGSLLANILGNANR